MEPTHVMALSHIAGVALGLVLLASVARSMIRSKRRRVRSEYAPPRRPALRSLRRFIARILRAAGRLAIAIAFTLASPIGLLCANRRYPLVKPVLAPCEGHLAALGHRTDHARCFPLLAWTVWLVRCAGCHQRSFLREVPAPDGVGVELKVIGASPWRTRRCTAEYLTAQPASPRAVTQPVHPIRYVHRRRARPVPAGSPTAPMSRPRPAAALDDQTA